MTHESAAQRYRRLKADKLRRAQIAPSHPVEPVVCRCRHARLLHRYVSEKFGHGGECTMLRCSCTEYREA